MLGATMKIDTDEYRGQRVGSRLRLHGGVLGVPLSVNAVVVAHERPSRKVWETIGEPHLLTKGPYRMYVTVTADGSESRVRIGIDYALPHQWLERLLGRLLGAAYARWCVREMVKDLDRAFV